MITHSKQRNVVMSGNYCTVLRTVSLGPGAFGFTLHGVGFLQLEEKLHYPFLCGCTSSLV